MMFYLTTILIALVCRAHGRWYPETCDVMDAKVHAAANATAGVVALENNRAWYVMKRYPCSIIGLVQCQRVVFRHLADNGIQFIETGKLNGTNIEINTMTKPFDIPGTYTITYSDLQGMSTLNGTVKILFLNSNFLILWYCTNPGQGTSGSEQIAWLATPNGVITSTENALAVDIFRANGLSFNDLVDTHFTPNCSTFNVTSH